MEGKVADCVALPTVWPEFQKHQSVFPPVCLTIEEPFRLLEGSWEILLKVHVFYGLKGLWLCLSGFRVCYKNRVRIVLYSQRQVKCVFSGSWAGFCFVTNSVIFMDMLDIHKEGVWREELSLSSCPLLQFYALGRDWKNRIVATITWS